MFIDYVTENGEEILATVNPKVKTQTAAKLHVLNEFNKFVAVDHLLVPFFHPSSQCPLTRQVVDSEMWHFLTEYNDRNLLDK